MAMPVRVGEGPSSIRRSNLDEVERGSWVSIQQMGEENW